MAKWISKENINNNENNIMKINVSINRKQRTYSNIAENQWKKMKEIMKKKNNVEIRREVIMKIMKMV